MKISLNWLTDYVEVALPAAALGELFTNIGLNCDGVTETAGDVVFTLDVTSNRPDWLGHLGVARELAAATGAAFTPPKIGPLATSAQAADLTSVQVLDPVLCPRYTARVIRGLKVGPSPAWMVERLQAVGMRSINNVVDVTNYVMMEYSQPLHSFDFAKLDGRRIVVRRAADGEVLTSIDGTTCRLDSNVLVIADATRPSAIAGIMGSLQSEVTAGTTEVLIEAAQFDPLNIRRTSRKLGLMSESNYRFERGIDPVALEQASLRACQLILELAGGTLVGGMVDVWAKPYVAATVSLRPERTDALLGCTIEPRRQMEILDRLGLAPRCDGGLIVCTIPPHRRDLSREIDLIEEVARLEGYSKIPTGRTVCHSVSAEGLMQRTRRQVGQTLTACGFDEAMTFNFIDLAEAELLGENHPLSADPTVRRTNNVLRPNLLASLLRACKVNQDAGNGQVSLFELAAVFPPGGPGGLPKEDIELAMVTTRELRQLRGAVETTLARVDRDCVLEVRPGAASGFAEGTSAQIVLNGQAVGSLGVVASKLKDYYGLEHDIVAARLSFTAILKLAGKVRQYRPLAKFPAMRRDLSLIVDESVSWQQLTTALAAVNQPMRTAVEYVTTYRGKPVPPGRKSVTATLTYQSPTGTLRSEQVDQQIAEVVTAMKNALAAELRT